MDTAIIEALVADKGRLAKALDLVKDGADVTALFLAEDLREIESRLPDLVTICEVMGKYSVKEKLPYFGAIATREGKEALDFIRKLRGEPPLEEPREIICSRCALREQQGHLPTTDF